MNRHCVFIIALLLASSVLKAQQVEHDFSGSASGVGFRIGYGHAYNYLKINDHVVLAAFTDIDLGKEFSLNIRGEYFRTENLFGTVSFRDRQEVHDIQGPISWSDATLGAGLLKQLSSLSAIGAGVGLEWIKIHDIQYVGTGFVSSEAHSNGGYLDLGRQYSTQENLLRPSFYLMATMQWPMPGGVVIGTEFQYKFIFVGEKYSQNAFNSITSFGALVGVKYVLD
ncbi:MAG: hypothetical protein HY276_05485 [Ignavibacteriales bacterium]|nr:hypothetical protein [Ignavibacteriales bacterium]MBI3787694.1 hypothetical protein [Ignavibacteriales bacterium]